LDDLHVRLERGVGVFPGVVDVFAVEVEAQFRRGVLVGHGA